MGVGGIAYAVKIEPDWVDLVRMNLTLPRLDPAFAGFRLAQVSDFHLSQALTAAQIKNALALVLAEKPDLVAFTGDYVDDHETMTRELGAFGEVLRDFAKQVPVVAILGNHDYRKGASTIRAMLSDAGIRELDNDVLTLAKGESLLHICGVDDVWWGRPDLSEVLSRLPTAGSAVLMAHEPDYADVSSVTGRFDLQISGHSHGGQVVLPFIGPPVLAYLGEKYPSGLYRVGNMYQYTNRGLGTTTPHIRFNCRPEITVFTFQPGQA